MIIISSREFRERQKSYFDKVDEGIDILIQRGKNKSYRIMAVSEDDTLMSKEAFFEKLDRSAGEAQEGKIRRVTGKEELKRYLEGL